MKRMLTEKGMTLVEVLVAVGISAGVALVGSQLMGEFYSNQGYLEVQAEIQRQTNSVKNFLNNKANCNATFNRSPSPTSFNPAVSKNLYTNDGKIFLEPKDYGKYRLNQITISQSPNNTNLKNVNLHYTWPNKKFVKNHSFEKSVSVFVARNTNPSADPWSCSEVVEENRISMLQDLCNSLNDTSGGSNPVTMWDPIAQKCVLQEFKCGPNQVPTKLSSLGRFICTDIKTVLPPSSLINTGAVACGPTADNISITWSGSQYQLECSGGVTPPPPPPGPGSCSSACDCPNSYDACIAGACVTQSSMGACTHGTVVKGDQYCQWRCSGGGWTCPYPPMLCGGLTPALPVDGGWSNWSLWSLCVGNSQSRTRTCTNPAPANGGANCTGSATESRFCSTGPICPMQPYIPSGHYLATCQCPGEACATYTVVPNGQFALCPHCP